MARRRGTTSNGYGWSRTDLVVIWNNTVKNNKDRCGSLIRFEDHGDTSKKTGWEVDHIKPVSKGGSDHVSNLQALQWQTNRDKADKYPWRCGQ